MELAIQKRSQRNLIILIIAFILCLLPISIVIASALTDPTVGMTGVNNSDLLIGMTGITGSDQLIENGSHPTILNPSSGAGQLAVVTVIVFLAFSILLVLYLVDTKIHPLFILLTIGILIYMALALLPAINSIVSSLLGG